MGNNCCCGSPTPTDNPGGSNKKTRKMNRKQRKEMLEQLTIGEGPDATSLYKMYDEKESLTEAEI